GAGYGQREFQPDGQGQQRQTAQSQLPADVGQGRDIQPPAFHQQGAGAHTGRGQQRGGGRRQIPMQSAGCYQHQDHAAESQQRTVTDQPAGTLAKQNPGQAPHQQRLRGNQQRRQWAGQARGGVEEAGVGKRHAWQTDQQ